MSTDIAVGLAGLLSDPYESRAHRRDRLGEQPTIEISGGYMNTVLNSDRLIARVREHRLHQIDFDTLVGRGLSGALAVPVIARELGKNWLVVRKPHDASHSSAKGEGKLGRRWVFVDDFIATGDTHSEVLAVIANISEARMWETAFVGTYLYESGGFSYPDGTHLTPEID